MGRIFEDLKEGLAEADAFMSGANTRRKGAYTRGH